VHLREAWIEPKFVVITTGVVAVVFYGSLYPFQFQDDPDGMGPLHALFANWRQFRGWANILSNILLYIPFGLFAIRSLQRPRPFVRILLVACAALTSGQVSAQAPGVAVDRGRVHCVAVRCSSCEFLDGSESQRAELEARAVNDFPSKGRSGPGDYIQTSESGQQA